MRNLGLKLEMGAISWAVTETSPNGHGRLIASNVLRFDGGVMVTKSGDQPMTKDRTEARSRRRSLARKRMRKVELLKVLSHHGLCPAVPDTLLDQWRYRKIYPAVPELMEWLSVDMSADAGRNPYLYRYLCATGKLDLSVRENRFILGRALYHMVQRRGYRSNAAEGNDNAAGQVLQGIAAVSKDMAERGCATLGEYLYRKLVLGEKVRKLYTSRIEHYEQEFDTICRVQGLPDDLRSELHAAIFVHRPLKSQKHNVGHCVFEKGRTRVQRSHPRFEEYRMLSLVNNIKVRPRGYQDFRPLSADERALVLPLFFRCASYFDFEDIARKIAGKGITYGTKDEDVDLQFNYNMRTSVSGCPAMARIANLVGGGSADWEAKLMENYSKKVTASGHVKTADEMIDDIWQVLLTFDDSEKKEAWLRKAFPCADSKAVGSAVKADLDREYSNVSLAVVKKMLPYLRGGIRFDQAAFYANLRAALPGVDETTIAEAEYEIMVTLDAAADGEYGLYANKGDLVRKAVERFAGEQGFHGERLYHPSAIKVYPDAPAGADGLRLLGSPISSAFKNPVVTRMMHQVRHLVNMLIRDGVIDDATHVRVVSSAEVNSANERKGIARWQKSREEQNKEYAKAIEAFLLEKEDVSRAATEEEIQRYRLWEEQQYRCLYTGKTIALSDFLGSDAHFDIEHTVPISRGGDDSLMNKTLCEAGFNRYTKKSNLPGELDCYDEIKARLDGLGFRTRVMELENTWRIAQSKAKHAADRDVKNGLLQKATVAKLEYLYWKGKMSRFFMTEVPKDLAFQQDASGKIARSMVVDYLHSVFAYVMPLSSVTVDGFRREWKLPSAAQIAADALYDSIDACVAACIGKDACEAWEHYWKRRELSPAHAASRPALDMPWEGFAADVLDVNEHLIVKYSAVNRMTSGGRRKVRDAKGRLRRGKDGKVLRQQSDRVPMCFVKDTFYGMIEHEGTRKMVIRKRLDANFKEKDIDKVVDRGLASAMRETCKEKGIKALTSGEFFFNGHRVNHVRCFDRGLPSGVIPLTRHRDASDKEYKRFAYVTNDANYAAARYADGSGVIISGYEAALAVKEGRDIIPKSKGGTPLEWSLRRGQLVLFYHDSPDEVDFSSQEELSLRLYRFVKTAMNGRIPRLFLVHAAERRPAGQLAFQGRWDGQNSGVALQISNMRCLVEGKDFIISHSGKITKK